MEQIHHNLDDGECSDSVHRDLALDVGYCESNDNEHPYNSEKLVGNKKEDAGAAEYDSDLIEEDLDWDLDSDWETDAKSNCGDSDEGQSVDDIQGT